MYFNKLPFSITDEEIADYLFMLKIENDYYKWLGRLFIESFKNFQKFYEKMEEVKDDYIVLEDKNGVKVIIDKKEAQVKQSEILKKYNIEFDKSIDLRENR